MNLLQEALIAVLSGLTTKNEDGGINWTSRKIYPLDIEKHTYMVEWPDGSKVWYLNELLHREDGPAVEYADGSKGWWLNGKRHREDGPAVEYADGDKEWWINGCLI